MSKLAYDVRLRRYTPGGAAGPILPTLTIDFSAPRSDIPTLSFTAAEKITGTLPDLLEAAVEVWNGAKWIEPKNGRFFLLKRSGDDMDPAQSKTITCVSLISFLLSKAEIVTDAGADMVVSGTAGKFFSDIVGAAKNRGWGSYLGFDFTATSDSAGATWVQDATLAMSFTSGTTLASALQTLADQGAVEYETQGRTLHLYNPATGDDLSAGIGKVQVGAKAKELPVETTNEDLATHVTIRGDAGASWTFPIAGATSELGRLELSLSASGVTDQAQAQKFADLYQATGAQPRHQYTITEPATELAAHPFVGYKPGDWVSARRPHGWERMRVTQVQIRKSVNLVIDIDTIVADRLTDLATRIAKRNAALGARLAGNGRFNMGSGGLGGTPNGGSMPTPGGGDLSLNPGFGFGSEGHQTGASAGTTAPDFTISNITQASFPGDYTSVMPSGQSDGNIVFGTTGSKKLLTSQAVQNQPVPYLYNAGTIDIYSGWLGEGTVNQWGLTGTVELDEGIVGRLFQGDMSNRPGSQWTGTEFSNYYITQQTIQGGDVGQCFATGSYLYIPLACTVNWGLYKSDGSYAGTQVQITRTKFISVKISAFGSPWAVSDVAVCTAEMNTADRRDYRFAKAGTRVAMAWTGSGGLFVGNFPDGNLSDAGWSKLPASGLVENSAVNYAVASSSDGSGISLYAAQSTQDGYGGAPGTPVKELQVTQELTVRDQTSSWQTLSSTAPQSMTGAITTRAGRIVVGSTKGTWMSFTKDAGFKVIGAASTDPSGASYGNPFAFSYDGFVYVVGTLGSRYVVASQAALLTPTAA